LASLGPLASLAPLDVDRLPFGHGGDRRRTGVAGARRDQLRPGSLAFRPAATAVKCLVAGRSMTPFTTSS
jgi:hypothetical protein